jgi:hypothetical protein
MRYLSSISLALIVHVLLSIGILMALACTATPATPANTPNIDATVEAAISATKTAEEGVPNLTDQMLLGLMNEYHQDYKNAGQPTVGFLSGAACLGDTGYGVAQTRFNDLRKSFDPRKKEWEIQATGRLCNGVEYFYINDVTGKVSR